MTPTEQRQAVITLCLAVADAKVTGNPKLFGWATAAADKELLTILPDPAPKPKLEDFINENASSFAVPDADKLPQPQP